MVVNLSGVFTVQGVVAAQALLDMTGQLAVEQHSVVSSLVTI